MGDTILEIVLSLLLLAGGLYELYAAGAFGHWLTKKGTAATSPFTLASLGSGAVIGIFLAIGGVIGMIMAISGAAF